MAQQSSGVNSKHFFAIVISCGRLERVGAVMNSGNLKKVLKSGIIAVTLLVTTILTTQQLEVQASDNDNDEMPTSSSKLNTEKPG